MTRAKRKQDGVSDRTRWRGVRVEERIAYIAQMFIAHPLAANIIEVVNRRTRIRLASQRARGILILAPPDGGKTRLIRYLEEQHPPKIVVDLLDPSDKDSIAERTERPLVCMSIPNPCNMTNVASAILDALEHPNFRREKDKAKQIEIVQNQLKLARTIILAVDNVQDIPELRGPKGTFNTGNLFRDIIEKCSIVVLFFGTGTAEIVIRANEQLRKRVPSPLSLGGYNVATTQGLASALRVLHEFDNDMPLAESSGLGEGALGRGLACAADGRVGAMSDLLIESLVRAREAGRERITIEDAKKAYQDHYLDYSSAIDPFASGFIPRRLVLPGEPHFTAIDERKRA